MIVRFDLSRESLITLAACAKRAGEARFARQIERAYRRPQQLHCSGGELEQLRTWAYLSAGVSGVDISVIEAQHAIMVAGLAAEASRPRGPELGPAPMHSFLVREQQRHEANLRKRRREAAKRGEEVVNHPTDPES